jgi:hypothetical protein
MRYVVDCVIMHPRKQALGLRRSGGEGTPRVGDVLDVRIADIHCLFRLTAESHEEIYGIQYASLVCSTYTL